MWRKLTECEPPYFLKYYEEKDKEGNTFYNIHITNFIKVWLRRYTKKEFLAQLVKSNDGLEMDENECLMRGIHILTTNTKRDEVIIVEANNGNKLKITLVLGGSPVSKLKFEVILGTQEQFDALVLRPIWSVILDLKKSEQELINLVKQKDEEIEEYMSEGAELSLKHLKTDKFDESKYLESHKAFEEHFGPDGIPKQLLKRKGHVALQEEPSASGSRSVIIRTEKKRRSRSNDSGASMAESDLSHNTNLPCKEDSVAVPEFPVKNLMESDNKPNLEVSDEATLLNSDGDGDDELTNSGDEKPLKEKNDSEMNTPPKEENAPSITDVSSPAARSSGFDRSPAEMPAPRSLSDEIKKSKYSIRSPLLEERLKLKTECPIRSPLLEERLKQKAGNNSDDGEIGGKKKKSSRKSVS